MTSAFFYHVLCVVLALGVLLGLTMMSKVSTAVRGNALSAICVAAAVALTLTYHEIVPIAGLWIVMALGLAVGLYWAQRIAMIQMPQVVALLNGFGGAASALVAIVILWDNNWLDGFSTITAGLALVVGMITLTGSLVAAGKLHGVLPQKPVVWRGHQGIAFLLLAAAVAAMLALAIQPEPFGETIFLCMAASALFGYAFAIRVGGADMPITISLLNSLSGVAGAIAGMAVGDFLLVAIGGIVGASGLLLTRIMCKAMNRRLPDILFGTRATVAQKTTQKTTQKTNETVDASKSTSVNNATANANANANADVAEEAKAGVLNKASGAVAEKDSIVTLLKKSRRVIIIPGYGMALAQAQQAVAQLADSLEKNGATVDFAIHPVAGRMPGHMNVLLAEANIPYEKLREMDDVNNEFGECDLAIVVGANDVVNPAANTAEGTPIYGMPVLAVEKAKNIVICNFDRAPGYAGVANPLYEMDRVTFMEGNAADTVRELAAMAAANNAAPVAPAAGAPTTAAPGEAASVMDVQRILHDAKRVIIVPGYGMALAQAQQEVAQLADRLEKNGATVDFAIHPVAGRMPGHMNVLLAEANIPYEKLREMDDVNDEFGECDLAIVVGANDVVNPAANTAEGTPIYGMPVLAVEKAKNIVVCNFDRAPGYAGVANPLYERDNVIFFEGDAAATVRLLR